MFQEAEEEDERTESCEMEHSYDDTVNNILIVSQDESSLDSALGAGDGPSTSSVSTSASQGSGQTVAQPLYNIVPLAPNSYLQSLETRDHQSPLENSMGSGGSGDPQWGRNRPRDPSRYVRSRLERCNAIRRGIPSSEHMSSERLEMPRLVYEGQSNLLEGRLHPYPSDSNQEESLSSNSNLYYRLENLMQDLRFNIRDSNNRSSSSSSISSFPPSHRVDRLPRVLTSSSSAVRLPPLSNPIEQQTSEASSTGNESLSSFPHAADVESALREHETFNLLVSRTQARHVPGGQAGLTPNSSGDSIGQVFSNGYLPSDEENAEGDDDSSDHEGHSDSENFYDDNFEDYDEHYNVVADEFAVSADNEEEEEPEIRNLDSAGDDPGNSLVYVDSGEAHFFESILSDNRFARDDDEENSETIYDIHQDSENRSDHNSEPRVINRT